MTLSLPLPLPLPLSLSSLLAGFFMILLEVASFDSFERVGLQEFLRLVYSVLGPFPVDFPVTQPNPLIFAKPTLSCAASSLLAAWPASFAHLRRLADRFMEQAQVEARNRRQVGMKTGLLVWDLFDCSKSWIFRL